MADPRIRIVVEAVTSAAEASLKKVQTAVKETGEAGEKSSKLFDGFKGSLAAIAGVAGIVTAGVIALKKAFDFAKEGAAIAQTAASFDGLMQSMGKGPGVLNSLRDASRGTVDDLTLMKGTLTLVAGASEQLASAMIDAAPQLMEIAKAANKLNPTLGTTAFMYDSLALGIKRASPLILDNLGLVVKVGDANQKMAASLGKSVEQLTAEEQKTALLNATLEAGQRLIEQVGGNVDSMTDSFAQSETAITNATDTIKTRFAPAVATVLELVAGQVKAGSEWASTLEVIGATLRSGDDAYQNYITALMAAARESGMLLGVTKEGEASIRAYALGLEEGSPKVIQYADYLGILTKAEWEYQQQLALMIQLLPEETRFLEMTQAATASLYGSTVEAAAGTGLLASALGASVGPTDAAAAAIANAAAASDAFDASMDLLHEAIRGPVTEAIVGFQAELATLDGQLAAGDITLGDYTSAVDELTSAFENNMNQMIFNVAEGQILDAMTKNLIADTNASGTAYDEATAMLFGLADALGITDAATLALSGKVLDATGKMIDGSSSTQEWTGTLTGLSGELLTAAGGSDTLTGSMTKNKEVIGGVTQATFEATAKTYGWHGPMQTLSDKTLSAAQQVFSLTRNIITLPASKNLTIYTNADWVIGVIGYLHSQIDALHGKNININVHVGLSGPGVPYLQEGGQFTVRGPAGPDRVPVMFRATAGETVTVTPAGQPPPPNPNTSVHNNYNLTIHSSSPAESAIYDFSVMKALAGV